MSSLEVSGIVTGLPYDEASWKEVEQQAFIIANALTRLEDTDSAEIFWAVKDSIRAAIARVNEIHEQQGIK